MKFDKEYRKYPYIGIRISFRGIGVAFLVTNLLLMRLTEMKALSWTKLQEMLLQV